MLDLGVEREPGKGKPSPALRQVRRAMVERAAIAAGLDIKHAPTSTADLPSLSSLSLILVTVIRFLHAGSIS